MLPTANIHDDLASRLRCWLPQERNLDSRATDLRRLRRYISSYPRPKEPLLGAIFFEGQLKYFTNTRREKREDETIYEYIAALWELGSLATTPTRGAARQKELEEKLQRRDTFVGDSAKMFKEGMKYYHALWDTFLAYYGRIVALVAPSESTTLNPSEQQEPQHDNVKQEPLPKLYYGSINDVTSESINWIDEFAKPKYKEARDALVAATPVRTLTAEEVEELMQLMQENGF